MYYLADMCFICLKHDTYLCLLSKSYVGNMIYSKLIDCLPVFDGKCFKSAMVCAKCIDMIESMYSFRKMCLENHVIYLSYINQLNRFSKVKGKVNVYLKDCYADVEHIIKIEENVNEFDEDITVNCSENAFVEIKMEFSEDDIEVKQGEIQDLTLAAKEGIDTSFCKNSNESFNLLKKSIEKCVIKKEREEIENVKDVIQEKINIGFNGKSDKNELKLFEYQDNFELKNEEVQQSLDVIQSKVTEPGEKVSRMKAEEMRPDTLIKEGPTMFSKKYINSMELSGTSYETFPDTSFKKYNFKCNECSESFLDNINLIVHKIAHKINSEKKPFKSDEYTNSISKNDLRVHKELQSKEKPFKCDECLKSFSQKSHLTSHSKIHSGEKPFKCDECSKCFIHRFTLNSHKKIHSGEKPFKCDECLKCFSHKFILYSHKIIHSGEQPFTCHECSKSFSQRTSLIHHKRIHSGEKPFKCDECLKSFSKKSSLIDHKRIHSGEKPFKCDECLKSFSQRHHLISHKRIHSGEKPYKCEECLKCFSHLYTLTVHKRTHSGEKPFICDQCSKSFSQREHLIVHRRVHSGEKPYKCNICSVCFTYSRDLTRHKKLHNE